MKTKFLQYLFLSCSLMVLFSACRKESFKGTETLQSGKTYVWIDGAPVTNQFFDVFTDIKLVKMFMVRRDAANNGDLQKAITVKLTVLSQAYLDKQGGGYTSIFPTNIYTMPTDADITSGGQFLGDEGITKDADGFTLKFAVGEFAKTVYFYVDGSKVDLSKQYAAAFAISDHGGFSGKHNDGGASLDTVLSTIAIKNAWDGNYDVTGSYTDANIPSALGHYPYNIDFQTISATSNDVYDYDTGGYAFGFTSVDGPSSYGSFSPEFTFDPVTNKVTSIVNAYGQGSGGHKRSIRLDPSGVNAYDPASKTIKVKYIMVSDGADRCHFDETYTYKKSR
jgi:hypothetical protein